MTVEKLIYTFYLTNPKVHRHKIFYSLAEVSYHVRYSQLDLVSLYCQMVLLLILFSATLLFWCQ